MSKRCAKCEKTVYPTEELKCLDKIWHKICFKCQECNMTLNMKNYKGYNKLPYCNAHYPTTKHTVVADTPESRRIAENTKIQSNIKYHEDFEKMKGKKASVVDDPELMRIKQNTAIQSNIEYHKTRDQLAQMEQRRPAHEQTGETRIRSNPGKISDYEPDMNSSGTPYSARNQQARVVYDSNVGKADRNFNASRTPSTSSEPRRSSQRLSSSGSDGGFESTGPSRRVGSIADYDPMNDQFGSIGGGREPQRTSQPIPQSYQPPPQQYQPPPPQPQQPVHPDRYSGKGMCCQAMYDYTAADDDEVSFADGDVIIFCQPIDQGWMEGTVERTGQRGMLPSNYVEPLK